MSLSKNARNALALLLRPLFPRAGWIVEALWEMEIEFVSSCVKGRRFDRIEPALKNMEEKLPQLGCRDTGKVAKLNRLGELFQEFAGSYDHAEQIFREAAELARADLGGETRELLLSLNNLGLNLLQQRRTREAEGVFEEVLPLAERLFGEAHPETASSLENLAAAYRQNGRQREAAELRSRAVRIRNQTA